MRIHSGHAISLCLCLLALLSLGLCGDELRLADGTKLQGVFLGLDAKGKVSFQCFSEEAPWEGPLPSVKRLKLDKPVKITFYGAREPKKGLKGTLGGYKDGNFRLTLPGDSKPQELPSLRVAKLEVAIDMADFLRRKEEFRRQQAADNAEKAVEISEMLQPGKAAIVHFHSPTMERNERQGSLARRLCDSSKGKAVYLEIMVDSLQSPTAKKYKLKSLPQFWFYNGNGKQTSRLDRKFTEEEIEEAFRHAVKGR